MISARTLFIPLLIISSLRYFPLSQANNNNSAIPVHVGLILDFKSLVGKIGNSCITIALRDFYATRNHSKTLIIRRAGSENGVLDAASAAVDLLHNAQVEAIIGPQRSGDADFVASLGGGTQVPIVSFSATSPFLSSSKNPFFVRTAENDPSQVDAMVAVVRAFGWPEVVPVYVDNDFGKGVIPFLTDALQQIGVTVPYRSLIPPSADDRAIGRELERLDSMQTRVFVVHLPSALGARFFRLVNKKGMMSEGYVWIVTNSLGNLLGSMNVSVIQQFVGVIGVKTYIPPSAALRDFTRRWKTQFESETGVPAPELNAFGVWAYDTAWALAEAAERAPGVGIGSNKRFVRPNVSAVANLSALGVSPSGPGFLRALLETRFVGLRGEFRLVDGQLQARAFQVINVGAEGEIREIGFWNPGSGLHPDSDSGAAAKYPVGANPTLWNVTWPGGSNAAPKGWMIPVKEKWLRNGVPVKEGYKEFVGIVRDPATKKVVDVQGYAIDFFKAVLNNLSYPLPYYFDPFQNESGQMNGTYDDLVYQVYLGKYDAVVGDVTIIANRSNFVDFTLPYSESGVSMLVPIKPSHRNTWIFLKPLTVNLWLTTGAFFVLTGLVVWVLERAKGRSEFEGPLGEQMGLVFNFIFSTMVFAHKERLVSNLSRFVIIIWVFVVLILTSSYTASLTSMLTVQQLEPSVTDLQALIRNGDCVGYRRGSFVKNLLLRMGVPESRIRDYNGPDDFPEAFSKGGRNGGVAAIFDEVPYNKIFLAKHAHKYTTVGPTYKTGGHAFVFPRKSPLVSDISKAILNVAEGEKMVEIEKKWISNQTSEAGTGGDQTDSSGSLSLSSFWGLFLITGTTSCGALLIYAVQFLRQYASRTSESSSVEDVHKSKNVKYLWGKIWDVLQHFDEKDHNSLTFRHMVRPSESEQDVSHGGSEPDQSFRQSPVSVVASPATYQGGYDSSEPDDFLRGDSPDHDDQFVSEN